ncbi:MAG: hypothetical protein KJ737_18205 [Proteobacteria bacterium]|nr:hypothetical protein [Pseudomonadota bacterium]
MDKPITIEPCLTDAIEHLQNFVGEITGKEPSQQEISKVLKRYFILKEILDQIKWEREHPEHQA